jgi:hypothetical protein
LLLLLFCAYLLPPHHSVTAILGKQFVMGASFSNLSFMEAEDLIGRGDSRQAMTKDK